MHTSEILHRDLKPGIKYSVIRFNQIYWSTAENILIRENKNINGKYEIKVIDFGLSFKN